MDEVPPASVPKHPGIYKKGSATWCAIGHQRRQPVAKSFRTLCEAMRFQGKAASRGHADHRPEPFQVYAKRWVETYNGRTARGVSERTRASYADAMSASLSRSSRPLR